MDRKPKVLPSNTNVAGTHFVQNYQFACGSIVPIFEAETMHGLNQILGKAKFINQNYGEVFYRGECKLHESLIPSIFRTHKNASSAIRPLNALKRKIIADTRLSNFIKLSSEATAKNHQLEGVLQHYGIKTRYIDLVDNHWIALWMGHNNCVQYKIHETYYHYEKRELPIVENLTNPSPLETDKLYQYILLIAMPHSNNHNCGITEQGDFILVDLRQALPSTFLRPHAQHGLVMRKVIHTEESVDKYDLATEVVGIVRIRIDKAEVWLGNGALLSQENLFPAPGYDTGYDVLLTRVDIFSGIGMKIAKYIS